MRDMDKQKVIAATLLALVALAVVSVIQSPLAGLVVAACVWVVIYFMPRGRQHRSSI